MTPGSGGSSGEGKASHSSILARRIPWTEEPGELRSMGSQSVRHSCVPEHKIKPEELYNNIIIYTNISVHMRLERVETLHEACKPKVWRAGTIAGTGARAHSKQSRRSSCPFGACFLEGGRQHRLRGDGKSLLFFGLGLLEERTPPGKLSKMRRRR